MNKDFLKQKIQENKIRELQNSNKKNYPSNFQMVKNLTKDVVRNVKSISQGNPINASDAVINHRKSICGSCEFFDRGAERCTKCGCNMAIKTYLKASNCPIGKW
jgi:hypothetical protein